MDEDAKGPLLVFIPPDPEEERSSRRVRLTAVLAVGLVVGVSLWVLWPSSPSSRADRDVVRYGDDTIDSSPSVQVGRPAVVESERRPPAAEPAAPAPAPRSPTPERRYEPSVRVSRPASPPERREPPSAPNRLPVSSAPATPPSFPVARPIPAEPAMPSAEPAPSPAPAAPEPPSPLPTPAVPPPPPPPAPRPALPRQNGAGGPRPEEVRIAPTPAPASVAAEPVRKPDRPVVRGAPPVGSPGGAAALGSAPGPGPLGVATDPRRAAAAREVNPPPPAPVPRRAPAAERRLVDTVTPAVVRVGAPGRGGVGFIVDPEGYIVTSHQIANTAGPLAVTLHDGRTLPVRIVARDPLGNVAVLKVDATGLPAVALGDSKALRVGEPVIAVGRGSGQGLEVAIGSIRATGAATGGNLATDFPGRGERAGGPLVNARGEAVGVTTGGGDRYGAAVPIDRVKPILRDLKAPPGAWSSLTVSDR